MDRSHAPYAIARYLAMLGLASMTSGLITWLGLYDGFEVQIPEQDDPASCVRDLLAGYVLGGRPALPSQVYSELASLPFVNWRACWKIENSFKAPRNWNSLTQPWIEFQSDATQFESLHVWWSDEPCPNPMELRSHLIHLCHG